MEECLTLEHIHRLQHSGSCQLSLLRALRPCLPNGGHLRSAYAKACSNRIPFLDGCWRVHCQTFEPLPFQAKDMVVTCLSVKYQSMQACTEEDLAAATNIWAQWFPLEPEGAWALRWLARALCPQECMKSAIIQCDTLGPEPPGGRGKSTLLYLLRGLTGCQVLPGEHLCVGRAHGYLSKRAAASYTPLLECFDELSGAVKPIDLASLKVLTSGQPPACCMWIASNADNIPSLQSLHEHDPAALQRLIFLPARPLDRSSTPCIHAEIDRLLPAFAKLLLEEHERYAVKGSCQSQRACCITRTS